MNPFQVPPASAIIREVGLRDGLQSIERTVPTEHKKAWLQAAWAAGLPRADAADRTQPAAEAST